MHQQLTVLCIADMNVYAKGRARTRALTELGVEVIAATHTRVGGEDRGCPEFSLPYQMAHRLGYHLDTENVNGEIRDALKSRQPDLVWIEKGTMIRPSTLKRVKTDHPHLPVVSYSDDDMFLNHNRSRAYVKGLKFYDCVFTTKAPNRDAHELPALGARRVVLVDKAFDAHQHHPVEVSEREREELGADVAFIGTYERERARSLLFLARKGVRVRVWGNGWETPGERHANLRIEGRAVVNTDTDLRYTKAVCATRIMADHLGAMGHTVTVAHYATLSAERELTGSLSRLLTGGRPGMRRYRAWDGTAFVSVGCWLPELETTYYLNSRLWRPLVRAHDRHLAVGGTALVAAPLVAAGVPHLIWCASDMLGDRIDRRRAMPLWRRAYDRVCVAPFLAALERRILAGPGRVMGVSAYAVGRMRAVSPDASRPVVRLPVPVDGERFHPPVSPPAPGVVGFIGRLSDARKNPTLLLDAVALARRQGHGITAVLAGERPPELVAYAAGLGLEDRVTFPGHVDEADLPAFYQGLDVFVIPSHQEGLNIAGVQAAASGVPIVSTRCGGPEGYVKDGVTGFLTGFDAAEIASRITQVVTDRSLRDTLSANARAMAEAEYATEVFARTLDEEWRHNWEEGVEGP